MAKKQKRYCHPHSIVQMVPDLIGRWITMVTINGEAGYVKIEKLDNTTIFTRDMRNISHRYPLSQVSEIITDEEV